MLTELSWLILFAMMPVVNIYCSPLRWRQQRYSARCYLRILEELVTRRPLKVSGVLPTDMFHCVSNDGFLIKATGKG